MTNNRLLSVPTGGPAGGSWLSAGPSSVLEAANRRIEPMLQRPQDHVLRWTDEEIREVRAERDRLQGVNEELLAALEALLADVLNLASWSVRSRPSVATAARFLPGAKPPSDVWPPGYTAGR